MQLLQSLESIKLYHKFLYSYLNQPKISHLFTLVYYQVNYHLGYKGVQIFLSNPNQPSKAHLLSYLQNIPWPFQLNYLQSHTLWPKIYFLSRSLSLLLILFFYATWHQPSVGEAKERVKYSSCGHRIAPLIVAVLWQRIYL